MATAAECMTRPLSVPNEDPRQCWSTPPEFMLWIIGQWGAFDLDVCASHDNAKAPCYFGAPGYHPPENKAWRWLGADGLARPWSVDGLPCTHCWCNPGFRNVEPWLEKAASEAHQNNAHVLLLTHATHSTRWFDKYIQIAHRCYAIRPRIQFDRPPGVAKDSSNPKDSLLWEFRRDAAPEPMIHVLAPWRPLG